MFLKSKFVKVVAAILFLLPNIVVASLPLEQRPFLAVHVSGHSDPNVNRVLGVELTNGFVQTERFRETPRLEEFLTTVNAESQRQTLNDGLVAAIARRLGIEQVCIVSMSSLLGSYYVEAKIINSETGATIAIGSIDNALATVTDIRNAAAGIVGAMGGAASQRATTPVATTPLPPHLNPNIQYGLFTDSRDNRTYHTVVMPDGKIWMAENLNFATSDGSWCYDNNAANCNIYGRLYNEDAVKTACPEGWRLPSADEWLTLISAVGGRQIAGTKLKSSTRWQPHSSTPRGTNDFGFSALPGGNRFLNAYGSNFISVDSIGIWWALADTYTTRWEMGYSTQNVPSQRSWADEETGYSARCVSTQTPDPATVPATVSATVAAPSQPSAQSSEAQLRLVTQSSDMLLGFSFVGFSDILRWSVDIYDSRGVLVHRRSVSTGQRIAVYTWDKRGRDGRTVPAGRYEVRATATLRNGSQVSGRTHITLR